MTPRPSATSSPILRVKAVPGKFPVGDQTRGGSPSSSTSSFTAAAQFYSRNI